MTNYEGSLIFLGLANKVGVPMDQVNFFVSQLMALIMARFYRYIGMQQLRHLYGSTIGIAMLYFCYGIYTVHTIILATVSYLILRLQPPQKSHLMVFAVALTYLCAMHFYRIYYNYGYSGVDISGPLMVMVQKVTSLAFSIHDGSTKTEEEMTQSQMKFHIKETPDVVPFFSYLFLFPSLLAGPIIYYKDYIDFIDKSDGHTRQSSRSAVWKKVGASMLCCVVFMILKPFFPVHRLKEDTFLESTDLSYKLWYISICTNLSRFKYYFAWLMADAICNNSGLGFNGLTPDGQPMWDKISNVDVLQFEFATSFKEAIEAWNKGTNVWLRFIAYERLPKFKIFFTYALSAVWHGFYPGYYITFFTGVIFTQAARIVRKNIRTYFVSNADSKKFYDVLTFMVTRFAMAYATFPFILYEFWPCIAIYNKFCFLMHLAAIFIILLVPNCLPRSHINPDKSDENVQIVRVFRSGSYRID